MKVSIRYGLAVLLASASLLAAQRAAPQLALRPDALQLQDLKIIQSAKPFQNNNGVIPPPKQYSGPFFALNHAWPAQPLPPLQNAPWQAAIGNGVITPRNAAIYAAALKAAVAANGRNLIMHFDTWDAAKAGWYNEPWLGSQREAIHGTYPAGEFGKEIFPGTGLRVTFGTHVLTYYDARAAGALRAVWGDTAMSPKVTSATTQFPEGSIIVKVAIFTSEDEAQQRNWWDALRGAQVWTLFTPLKRDDQHPLRPKVRPGYVAQFDIIVKDSQSAPKTGWVFMTLVYDRSVPGDVWDRMVPLGAQWGSDPQASEATVPLLENWINPRAPVYSTQTLGWGGRLSGPNDGARNDISVAGKTMLNEPDSSCMSCHSTSQWSVAEHRMPTFLLPSFSQVGPPPFKPCGPKGNLICSPAPGSNEWMKWFQDRTGSQPMDAGAIATDFDEVFSFKSLALWSAATNPTTAKSVAEVLRMLPHGVQYNEYNGAPLHGSGQ